MKKTNWILLGILVIALFLRLFKVSTIPPHLTPDEASLGYNAYSLLTTGKDEYGKTMPVIFKSFGDYKPGLYIYTVVPFVAILGLTELAVRLPSVLSGVLAVWLVYLIVVNFRQEKEKVDGKYAIFASLLLAINPWHVHFSRGAWEINLSLTLTLAGIYFFLKSLDRQKYLITSSVFFALTLLTYQGAKLSSALVLIALVVVFNKQVVKFEIKNIVLSAIVGLVIALPIILSLFSGKTGRLTVFSIFSYPRPRQYLQQFLDQNNEKIGSASYYLFHSETNNFARGLLGRYFNYYSGRYLFFEGDWQNPKHNAPNTGLFLLLDVFLFVPGIIYLVRNKGKLTFFVFMWLALAPIPAVLSKDQIHAVRSFNMVIPVILINSFGAMFVLNGIVNLKQTVKYAALAAFLIGYVANYGYYIDAYYVHLPKHDSKAWEYGYKQIAQRVIALQDKYDKVYIQQSYSQPYIYFLFYGSAAGREEYYPINYQKQAKLSENVSGDVGQVEKVGKNIEFVAFDWPRIRSQKRVLVVGDTIRIPDSEVNNNAKLIEEIIYLDTRPAFRIVETL
ncbi:MAG: glycosyltransferase family 39 protein [Patescibacteria group bacterium]